MRNPTSNNAYTIRIQGIVDFTPSKTWSQNYNRLVGADSELVDPLQVDKDNRVIDTGPAGIRRVAAALDREFRFEKGNNLECF